MNKELIKLADISGNVLSIYQQNEKIEAELAEIKKLLLNLMEDKS